MASKPGFGRAFIGGGLIVVAGYFIMKATTPTDQQFYDSLSPSLKKQVDMQRQSGERQRAYQEQLQRARELDEAPILPEKKA